MTLDKNSIVQLLATNDRAVARAVVVLNERQTSDEQASQTTRYHNGRGFTSSDAMMGTSCANYVHRKGQLTPKQLDYWRKPNKNGVARIAKYAGQLLEVAVAKAKQA